MHNNLCVGYLQTGLIDQSENNEPKIKISMNLSQVNSARWKELNISKVAG